MERKPLRAVVLDMQPITPAIGGGRQRLLGLYHALGDNIKCTYVGSYDWPGEPTRDQQITRGLRELTIPLSAAHHNAAAELSSKLSGRTVIDIAFPDQAHLSQAYLDVARQEIEHADFVIFSHPWCYPPLAKYLSPNQLIAYDAHNVESVLRTSLFDDLPQARSLLRRIVETEYELCRHADLVLACSHEDCETFHRIFGAAWYKLRTVPNGIFAFKHRVPSATDRAAAKRELGVTQETLAIFLGSGYGPNNEAARLIATRVAPQLPEIGFAVVGGCGTGLTGSDAAANVYLPGVVDDDRKHLWLTASDSALNPMAEGSGTCIKMFDYMAAGLPVITTRIGARGILAGASPAFIETGLTDIPKALEHLQDDEVLRESIASTGRQLVEENYAWERISPKLGMLLERSVGPSQPRPFFTVVIPTYERHAQLDCLMERLDAQELSDFEVVVVDQSASAWDPIRKSHAFPVRYIHSEVKGAVAARNLGGFLARGDVIAFTDDDCLPKPDWLFNARRWFRDSATVGLEGFIRSDHLDNPDWRPVTNIGCIGMGFMTANLMVRNTAFQKLGGFDLAFDRPHFREDTDLGWRLQGLGKVPFAPDVEVFHPAQPRSVERESVATRGRFFIKDALLLKKHPARYAELFMQEAHYLQTEGFWENLCRGLDLYNVEMPDWMLPFFSAGGDSTGTPRLPMDDLRQLPNAR